MRTFGGTTMTESSGPSNRRQPIRQTRTNSSRVSTSAALALNTTGDPPDGANEEAPGFYPAITHFTDAITALPKELIRHFQMLKEVDAKVYGPEENLSRLLSAGLKAPVPKLVDPTIEIEPLPGPESPELRHPRFARRALFLDVRRELAGLLMTLDEKNHVMNTAHDALEKQLKRCQSSFPYIEDEISEEARLGSMTHWAYNSEKPTEKKGMMAGERTRRAANHAAAVETDISAMRSEPRREAVPSRKSRLQNLVDSDFDETRTYAGKKTQNGNKSRKVPDGLGISNVPVVNNKRRKVEQPPSGGFPMGRSMSSVYASGARGSSPAIDSKKKARGAGAVTASNGKRRANGNTTGLNSPSASSPVIGTFPPSKDHNGRSPALSTAQRNTSSRTQQNLTHPRPTQLSRNRSSSTTNSHRRASAANGNGITDNHTTLPNHSSTSLDKLSTLTGKSTGDVRTTMRESLNAKGERMVEDNSIGNDGSTDMRGALVIGSAEQPKENGTTPHPSNTTATSRTTRPDRPPSISLSTRGNGHNTTANTTSTKSKTATPVTATFSSAESKQDHQRPSRPPRGRVDLPAKRSHKKGAGIQAQLAAAAAAAAKGGTKGGGGEATADEVDDDKMDGVELGAEEERGEGEGSGEGGEEPRYCYCGDVSYGEMVGCDADDCSREWFHLSCVGLSRAPAKTAKWYCDECKENLRRR